jgi:hypothetical protein
LALLQLAARSNELVPDAISVGSQPICVGLEALGIDLSTVGHCFVARQQGWVGCVKQRIVVVD